MKELDIENFKCPMCKTILELNKYLKDEYVDFSCCNCDYEITYSVGDGFNVREMLHFYIKLF